MLGHTYQVAQLAGAPTFTSEDVHILPLKAGLKFFPIPHIYLEGVAGAAFLLNKSNYYNDKSVAFVYAPQFGLQVPVIGSTFIDTGIRYEKTTQFSVNGSSINFWSVRIAYGL